MERQTIYTAFWNRWQYSMCSVNERLEEEATYVPYLDSRPGAQNEKNNVLQMQCKLHLDCRQEREAGRHARMGPCDGRTAGLQISNNSWKERCVALPGQEEPIHVSACHGHLNSGMWFPGDSLTKSSTDTTRQRPHWQMCCSQCFKGATVQCLWHLDFDANMHGWGPVLCLCKHIIYIIWGAEEVADTSLASSSHN